jgi:hypothetical protein
MERETDNIQLNTLGFTLSYLPVLWSTELEELNKYKEYFEQFTKKPMVIKDKNIYSCSFMSFVQIINESTGERNFEFGPITQLLDKLNL